MLSATRLALSARSTGCARILGWNEIQQATYNMRNSLVLQNSVKEPLKIRWELAQGSTRPQFRALLSGSIFHRTGDICCRKPLNSTGRQSMEPAGGSQKGTASLRIARSGSKRVGWGGVSKKKYIYIYIRAKKAEYYVRTEEPHSPSQHTSPFPVPASGVRPCAYVDAKKKRQLFKT